MTNNDAYQRLRELTRDNVLDDLHHALRPDIVAVLDALEAIRAERDAVRDGLKATFGLSYDDIARICCAAKGILPSQERTNALDDLLVVRSGPRKHVSPNEVRTLRERLAKLESFLDGECPTMPFPSCECCNAAARARELIASNESP